MKKLLQSLVLVPLATLALVGCNKKEESTINETTPLIFSSEEVDGVFNPFYSTTGADSTIVGMTQLSLISNDKNGNPTYGEDEAVAALDYQTVTNGSGNNQTTTYYFVLKNNVKYSNGSPLTIKDVLFNLYVYLDPVYTGSTTIYSTDIVGLQAYRTQSEDENEQDSFNDQFETLAQARINDLLFAYDEIISSEISANFTIDEFRNELADQNAPYYTEDLVKDYDKALELFKEELNNDYINNVGSYVDFTLEAEDGTVYKPFTTDVEMFLYNEGYIQFDAKANPDPETGLGNGELTYTWGDISLAKELTKDEAIDNVYNDIIPNKLGEVIQYWATATELFTYIANEEKSEYFANISSDNAIPNISGIKFANKDGMVRVNGQEYDAVQYNEDGSPKEGYNEVLSITINGVDPKAIWNFAFPIAPMYYYSSTNYNGHNLIEEFDFVSNFGVVRGDQNFQNNVIKDPAKIGVPVGAGAYMASKQEGGTDNVQSGDFLENNVIYYERNPHFIMGRPTIKMIRYTVVASTQMINSLETNAIDYVSPNSTNENKAQLEQLKQNGKSINYKTVQSLGYGYIGVNAKFVPTLEVRQAIMHAINTNLTVNYYGGSAKPIYRGMSLSSWAYPQGATAYYPYIGDPIPSDLTKVNPYYRDYVEASGKRAGERFSQEEQIDFITSLVESAGYYEGKDGVYSLQDFLKNKQAQENVVKMF